MMFEDKTIAERTVFTPGERAVVVERAEAMGVDIEAFVLAAKQGTSTDLINALIKVQAEHEAIMELVGGKLRRTILNGLIEP